MPQDQGWVSVEDYIREQAQAAGVPPELALAVAEQESSFNPSAVGKPLPSGAKALGTFQLLPETARRLGVDPTDPKQNIQGGVRYLRELLDRHRGDLPTALAEYGGVQSNTTYVPGVLAKLQTRLQGATGGSPAPGSTGGRLVGQPPPDVPLRQPAAPGARPRDAVDQAAAGAERIGPPETWAHWGLRKGRELLSTFDPRTPEGRQNLAGGAGAALATTGLIATAPVSVPVTSTAAALAGIAGAYGGGALEETGEQLVGTKPPSGAAIIGAGGLQAAYETLGQAFIWPFKAGGRRILASGVGQRAREGLKAARTAVIREFQGALDTATAAAGDVKALAGETVRHVRRTAAESLRGARRVAREGVQAAEREGAAGVSTVEGRYGRLVGQPPSAITAGEQARAILRGPAQRTLDRAGGAVTEAAAHGPDLSLGATKAQAQRIFDDEIKDVATYFSGTPEAQATGRQALETLVGRGATAAERDRLIQRLVEAGVPTDVAERTVETANHPAMGVIRRILNAPDTVPFRAAHQLKRELDATVNWESPARAQVKQITKGLRQSLRETMRGYAPYDAATARYESLVPLFTKGSVARFRKVATADPEAIVRLLSPKRPSDARMLRDVLTTQAAEGGGGAEGQAAWDSVRAAWTHQNLLKDGLGGLNKQLQGLTSGRPLEREFADIIYGDPTGQTVLGNLQAIARAYEAAKAAVPELQATARAAGETAVEQARTVGAHAVEQATQAAGSTRRQAAADIRSARLALREARQPTEAELRFLRSSLAHGTLSPEQIGADVFRGALIRGYWGLLSIMRLVRGPTEKDLLEWAAYSPTHTQHLVRLMTGPNPSATVIADVLRGLLTTLTSSPPPTAATPVGPVGQPPPGMPPPARAQGAGPIGRSAGAPPPPPSSQIAAPPSR